MCVEETKSNRFILQNICSAARELRDKEEKAFVSRNIRNPVAHERLVNLLLSNNSLCRLRPRALPSLNLFDSVDLVYDAQDACHTAILKGVLEKVDGASPVSFAEYIYVIESKTTCKD